MSLIIPRNFKRAKAHDAADKTEKIARDSAIVALFQPLADAQAELRDGNKKSNAKNVLAAAIAAAEKEFKGNPFSSRDKRIIDDAKKVLSQFDAVATDAKFKIGDRVKCIKHTIMMGGRDAYGVVGRVELVDTEIFGPEDPIYEVSIAGHNYGTETFAEEALVKA